VQADTTDAVLKNWDQIKRETKRQKSNREVLESVSPAMPALMRAQKVRKKAAKMGEALPETEALKAQIAAAVMQVQAENGAGKKETEVTAETPRPSVTPVQEEKLSPEPTKAPSATPVPSPVPSERPLPSLTPEVVEETAVQPHPVADLSPEALANPDYFKGEFFIEDKNVSIKEGLLNAAKFLEKDMTLKQDASAPQILIYHSHSQEAFIDSREGKVEDTIVGVGDYLKSILEEKYGYHVMHVKEEFDMAGGGQKQSLRLRKGLS